MGALAGVALAATTGGASVAASGAAGRETMQRTQDKLAEEGQTKFKDSGKT